ncbi:MAG: hypothetical protein Q8P01_00145 [bacterium]|nr:hypothetical protein [bacterium]
MAQETQEKKAFRPFHPPIRERRTDPPTVREPFKPSPAYGFGRVRRREEIKGELKPLNV